MLTEIPHYGATIALIAAGLALAVLATSLTERLPVPAPALFLVGAAIVASVKPSLVDGVQILTVERVAVAALIAILLHGGMDIGARRFRESLGAIASVGLIGTFLTAGLLALAGHVVLGLDWKVAGVLGAALAPTDPAVMFSVLGRREVGGRSGTVLEGEAGINDPAGIALLLGMVEVATHADATLAVVVREFAVEMSIGVACGVAGGAALIWLLHRVQLSGSSMYPVLVLGLACGLYGVTSGLHGSGFSAVFAAGLLLGDAGVPYREEVERFVAGLASLAEVVVFLALGLTVDLAAIGGRDWIGGLVLFALLAVLVRPAVVLATLGRARLSRPELGFIGWSGLKGAVPILLAAFAVLGDVPSSSRIYDLVFVVVLLSVIGQGSLVPLVARRLGIPLRERPPLPWELSVRLAEPPRDHVELHVEPGSAAEGATVGELPMPGRAWATIIVRRDTAVAAHPDLRLEAGDVVFALGVDDPRRLEAALAGPGA